MKRTPSTPHNVVTIDPAQSTRCVFGLRDRPRFMPCALGRDLQLAQMDAPDLLPAGSMTATEYQDGPRIIMESNVRRGASVCITAENWDREHAA